jgi:hypothetical protein
VRLESTAAKTACLKIRSTNSNSTVAQVVVPANGNRTVKLNSGGHQLLVKIDFGTGPEYFKGPSFEIPSGTRGTMILRFGVVASGDGAGSSLLRISPEDFAR